MVERRTYQAIAIAIATITTSEGLLSSLKILLKAICCRAMRGSCSWRAHPSAPSGGVRYGRNAVRLPSTTAAARAHRALSRVTGLRPSRGGGACWGRG
eukprot:8617063-Heterocapsa_arctica.AAC.1